MTSVRGQIDEERIYQNSRHLLEGYTGRAQNQGGYHLGAGLLSAGDSDFQLWIGFSDPVNDPLSGIDFTILFLRTVSVADLFR